MTSSRLARVWQPLALTLVGAGAVTFGAGVFLAPERTWPNVLLGNLYVLSIALASALFISIQYLSGSGWWVAVRRVAEAAMCSLPVLALLMPTIFLGRHAIYRWTAEAAANHAPLSPAKAFYLSTPFVLLRTVLVLAAWVFLVYKLRHISLQQDRDASPIHHRRLVRYSATFAVVFAFSFALATVDWLMAIDPHWSSTIFAVYVFAGLLTSGLAALTLIVIALRAHGTLRIVHDAHLHDLGQLLFAFSTFWAYIWLSQYLLVWYGNLPEEITHYVRRTNQAWLPIFLVNPIVNWAAPFLLLMRWSAKHNVRMLTFVCLLLILGHWLDLYLLIMPDLFEAPALGLPEALIPLGYAGLFAVLTSRALTRAPVIPVHDPFLEESLHHEA
jgi:hypothetical protein